MEVLNAGHFAGLGVGNAPNHPMAFCGGRVPKRPNRSCQREASGLFPRYHNDTPFPLARRQYVTSRAAVLVGRVLLSSLNQEFSEMRAPGACFAEEIGVHLTYLLRAPG